MKICLLCDKRIDDEEENYDHLDVCFECVSEDEDAILEWLVESHLVALTVKVKSCPEPYNPNQISFLETKPFEEKVDWEFWDYADVESEDYRISAKEANEKLKEIRSAIKPKTRTI